GALGSAREGAAREGLGRPGGGGAACAAALVPAEVGPREVRGDVCSRHAVAVSRRLPEAAVRAFERLVLDDPEDAQALYGLAAALVLRGEAAAGLRRVDQAIELRPDFVAARRVCAALPARPGRGRGAPEGPPLC